MITAGDKAWRPPGKDCGLCGARNCDEFEANLDLGLREGEDCPFYPGPAKRAGSVPDSGLALPGVTPPGTGKDILGHAWDFVLAPLPGEPSARKIVLPFRPDLVEKWNIGRDDIVLGRPFGAGCPVQHVLRVIRADPVTGVLETWVVGPAFSRNPGRHEVKDVAAYHMLGFEGLATDIRKAPVFGARHTFRPGFCMMHLNHTGLVNLILDKGAGLHVRVEDIRILAGAEG